MLVIPFKRRLISASLLTLIVLFLSSSVSAQVLNSLANFLGPNGRTPYAELVQGSDGNFYGTTQYGGSADRGTVFRMTPGGTVTTLLSFTGPNGANPAAKLVQGSDGNFYGTTQYGGMGCSTGCGTIFKITPTGSLTTLIKLNSSGGGGYWPQSGLVEGADGNFYGTFDRGGSGFGGSVYRITPSGSLTTLVNFTGANGYYPLAELILGQDGNFYGTTFQGGSSGQGTLFRMTPSGSLTTIVSFIIFETGTFPSAPLVQTSDGSFYGTTLYGGTGGRGTVFKVTPQGALIILGNFNDANGANPESGLVEGTDGNFYGTTPYGGAPGCTGTCGTVYRITPGGSLTTLLSFAGGNGSISQAGLIQASDGKFYGTTTTGGIADAGTVFSLDVSVAPASPTITSFSPGSGSTGTPVTIQGTGFSGTGSVKFNGVAAKFSVQSAQQILATVPNGAGTGAITVTTPGGSVSSSTPFTVLGALLVNLGNFDFFNNGAFPYASLIQASDGNFYGTTTSGGASPICTPDTGFPTGCGTVFKITPAGTLTTLVNFDNVNGKDPYGGLIQASDGNFYGTTAFGGSAIAGTVFRLTPNGVLTTLINFIPTNGNGSYPYGGLVEGSDGNFYGTTSSNGPGGRGTVFRISPSGTLTTLASFNYFNGDSPQAALIVGSDGNFYGTTASGGNFNGGTVFRMTPSGTLTTLANLGNRTGSFPFGALVEGTDGNFYGTTLQGGGSANCRNGCGIIFRMTPTGALTVLTAFNGSNGGNPYSGLVQGGDGNFYGTTSIGGSSTKCPKGCGTVYKITPGGTLTTLVNLEATNGRFPTASLLKSQDGNLYGTTYLGGSITSRGYGTVFRLNGDALTNLSDLIK